MPEHDALTGQDAAPTQGAGQPFRERLRWDTPGQVRDGAVRYLVIRTDTLMSAILRLSGPAQAEMLQALEAATFEYGGRSAAHYDRSADRPLIDVVAATAPDLGWGRWTVLHEPEDGVLARVVVEDSPFAAPLDDAGYDLPAGPLCGAITGMLRAVGMIMHGAAVVAAETRCAAANADPHGKCQFEIRLETE